MPLHDVDFLGIYVTPAVVCVPLGFAVLFALRWLLDLLDINRYVWNRALFDFSLLVSIVSIMVLSLRFAAA